MNPDFFVLIRSMTADRLARPAFIPEQPDIILRKSLRLRRCGQPCRNRHKQCPDDQTHQDENRFSHTSLHNNIFIVFIRDTFQTNTRARSFVPNMEYTSGVNGSLKPAALTRMTLFCAA
jgi:hypothetical protein